MKSRVFQAIIFASAVALGGCAPTVGPQVDAPEIPVVAKTGSIKSGVRVALQGALDVRPAIVADPDSESVTQPAGPVASQVEDGLRKALEMNGIAELPSAPVAMRAEIRKWQAQVSARDTGKLSSEASLFVELIDGTGQRIYSGNYVGNRASSFPLISASDIRESLGLAMASAIDQMMSDPKLIEKLSVGY